MTALQHAAIDCYTLLLGVLIQSKMVISFINAVIFGFICFLIGYKYGKNSIKKN